VDWETILVFRWAKWAGVTYDAGMPLTDPLNRCRLSARPSRRGLRLAPLLALLAGLLLTGCNEIWERSADGTYDDPTNRAAGRKAVGDAIQAAPSTIEFKDTTKGALVYLEGEGVKVRERPHRDLFKADDLTANVFDVAGDYSSKYDYAFALRRDADGSFSIRVGESPVWVKYFPRRPR